MSKIIKLNESSFKRLLEYVGDEEEFGRYDINNDSYNMPSIESKDIGHQLSDDYNVDAKSTIDDCEEEQYVGRDYFDPGLYGREREDV